MEYSVPLHPAIVHFAVVLPILTLVFQGLFLITKNDSYNRVTFVLAIFTALFVAGAWYSGGILQGTAQNIYPMLPPEGQEELKEHATLGQYLAISMAILAIVKIAATKLQKQILEVIFLVGLIVYIGATLEQGKDGGELVYEYGAGISSEPFDKYCEDGI